MFSSLPLGVCPQIAPPHVRLSHFQSFDAIAAWQAATIISLLNRIDGLAQEASQNRDWLSDQSADSAKLPASVTEDDDDDECNDRQDDTLATLAYLLSAVVAATAIPNLMLPYDMMEQFQFDNRPNPRPGHAEGPENEFSDTGLDSD